MINKVHNMKTVFTKTILVVVVLFLLNSSATSAYQDRLIWDRVLITFPKFNSLPITESAAKELGWYMLADDCLDTTSPFSGRRYFLNGDRHVIIIFDNQGQIAGIQIAIRSHIKPIKVGKYKETFIYNEEVDGGYYYVTAYFTNPGRICCSCGVRDASTVGDELIFMTGLKSRMNVPMTLNETYMAEKKWVKGLCFPNMGLHYWYDQTKDMHCDDLFPFFILYNNEGKLHAFGLGHDVVVQSHHYEYAQPQFLAGRFVAKENFPQCLITENKISPTMHVFFTKIAPATHGCTSESGGGYGGNSG